MSSWTDELSNLDIEWKEILMRIIVILKEAIACDTFFGIISFCSCVHLSSALAFSNILVLFIFLFLFYFNFIVFIFICVHTKYCIYTFLVIYSYLICNNVLYIDWKCFFTSQYDFNHYEMVIISLLFATHWCLRWMITSRKTKVQILFIIWYIFVSEIHLRTLRTNSRLQLM